ncbi:MAG: nucleotidyltransferase domain-containing protein [Bacteroidota bacterium]
MKNREKVIQKINELAWANYPELEIYLYGSQARGEAKHISDWDLLVLLKVRRISFKLETKLMDEFYDLELETGEIFSPLIYSESDWTRNHVHSPLYEIIQKDGIRIK